MDSGPTPTDSGPATSDAGNAGNEDPDSGTAIDDGGATDAEDGGQNAPDAGGPFPISDGGGFGYFLGGTITGLTEEVELFSGTGQSLTLTTDGPFTFDEPLLSGTVYSVGTGRRPTTATILCTVVNGVGVMGMENIGDVHVFCEPSADVTVHIESYDAAQTHLQVREFYSGQTLTFENGTGADDIYGVFPLAADAPYRFEILTQPTDSLTPECVVLNGEGQLMGQDVEDVVVYCIRTFIVDDDGDGQDLGLNDNCADTFGFCTLRAALDEANGGGYVTRIQIPAMGPITLWGSNDSYPHANNMGDLDFFNVVDHPDIPDIIVEGAGPNATTIEAQRLFRLVWIAADVNATIRDLRLTEGDSNNEGGSAIFIDARGHLTLERVDVTDNTPSSGNGPTIYLVPDANLTLLESRVAFNNAEGAFGQRGGAIWASTNTRVHVERSTISENFVTVEGGGIWTRGELTVINSEISRNGSNAATGYLGGGGIYLESPGTAHLTHVTMTDNADASGESQGGALLIQSGDLVLENTVIAENRRNISLVSDWACGTGTPAGTVTSLGGNFIGAADGCTFAPESSDQTGTEAAPLDPGLGNWFGASTTHYHHLVTGSSPLIDAAEPDACPETDLSGIARPVDGDLMNGAQCDIGAVEYLPF
jgi:hypothetical protein